MKRIAKIILLNLAVLTVGTAILEFVWRASCADDVRFSINVLAATPSNQWGPLLWLPENESFGMDHSNIAKCLRDPDEAGHCLIKSLRIA